MAWHGAASAVQGLGSFVMSTGRSRYGQPGASEARVLQRPFEIPTDARSWAPPCTCASITSRTSTPASCTELLLRKHGSHSKRIYAPACTCDNEKSPPRASRSAPSGPMQPCRSAGVRAGPLTVTLKDGAGRGSAPEPPKGSKGTKRQSLNVAAASLPPSPRSSPAAASHRSSAPARRPHRRGAQLGHTTLRPGAQSIGCRPCHRY